MQYLNRRFDFNVKKKSYFFKFTEFMRIVKQLIEN